MIFIRAVLSLFYYNGCILLHFKRLKVSFPDLVNPPLKDHGKTLLKSFTSFCDDRESVVHKQWKAPVECVTKTKMLYTTHFQKVYLVF